jgi:Copper binding periplasmic protein CusF
MTSGPTPVIASAGWNPTDAIALNPAARARWRLGLLFVALLIAFAAGLWGTVLRPAAYEVQGEFVARAAPDLILVRHEVIAGLGMSAMEQMAVSVVPAQVDALALEPGDRIRLAVRQNGERLVLLRIERR